MVKNLEYDIFDSIEEDISRFQNEGNIFIAGDLNAKTGSDSDFVSDLNDNHSPINDIDTYSCDSP